MKSTRIEVPVGKTLAYCHDITRPGDFDSWNRLVALVEDAESSENSIEKLEKIIENLWGAVPSEKESVFFNSLDIKEMEDARRNSFVY